jgi:hypothetical protein
MATDALTVIATNTIVTFLASFFNPWLLFRWYKRWKIQSLGPACTIRQEDANK